MNAKWIYDLKVGDEVIIAGILWTLAKVSIVTGDFVVVNGMKFHRDTGLHVKGAGFGTVLKLVQATPARVLIIKTDAMVSEIEEFNEWRKATPEEVEAVFAIVEKVRERR